MNDTISYYNQNAEEYFDKTVNVSMYDLYDEFEAYLKPGDKILDLGCGSGRDSRYFLSRGYEVVPVDGSRELCLLAGNYIGMDVRNITYEELDYNNEFDAVWACASLLHVDSDKLFDVFSRIKKSLKDKGVIYASWKYGHKERIDNGKLYFDLNEKSLVELFDSFSFSIEKMWISEDNLFRAEQWINVIGKM